MLRVLSPEALQVGLTRVLDGRLEPMLVVEDRSNGSPMRDRPIRVEDLRPETRQRLRAALLGAEDPGVVGVWLDDPWRYLRWAVPVALLALVPVVHTEVLILRGETLRLWSGGWGWLWGLSATAWLGVAFLLVLGLALRRMARPEGAVLLAGEVVFLHRDGAQILDDSEVPVRVRSTRRGEVLECLVRRRWRQVRHLRPASALEEREALRRAQLQAEGEDRTHIDPLWSLRRGGEHLESPEGASPAEWRPPWVAWTLVLPLLAAGAVFTRMEAHGEQEIH